MSKDKRSAKETIVALAKTAEEARLFVGEVADAAAAAAAAAKAAAGLALDKVATAIEERTAEGAKAAIIETETVAAPNVPLKKVTAAGKATRPKTRAKRAVSKRRLEARTTSRKAAKKKRT